MVVATIAVIAVIAKIKNQNANPVVDYADAADLIFKSTFVSLRALCTAIGQILLGPRRISLLSL
jgi:hypothetical protein